jgi:hypothetical protein
MNQIVAIEESNNMTIGVEQNAWELCQNATWVWKSWVATKKTKQQQYESRSNKRSWITQQEELSNKKMNLTIKKINQLTIKITKQHNKNN